MFQRMFIIAVMLLVLVGTASIPSGQIGRAQESDDVLQSQLEEVLAASVNDSEKLRTIESSLGFKLTYNKTMLDAQGQVTDASSTSTYVTGTTFTEDELDERRDYSIVKFRPLDSAKNENGWYRPELTVLTNIREAYWSNRVNRPEYEGKSKLEIFIAETTKTKQASGYEIVSIADRQINGIDYKEVVYSYKTDTYNMPYETTDRYYFTVQNDRPYYAAIYNIDRPDEIVPEYEAIIKSIVYEGLETDKLSLNWRDNDVLAASDGLPEGSSNIPQGFSTEGLLDVVAKNQIAVVRVGAIVCYDVDLTLSDGTVVGSITDACAGGVGSGSIITDNGYIATNGHVVIVSKATALYSYLALSESVHELHERSKPFMDFLVARGDLDEATRKTFDSAVLRGEEYAVRRALSLFNYLDDDEVIVKKETPSYMVQLSDKPVRMNVSSTSYSYSDGLDKSVVPAKLIDTNYDDFGLGKVDFKTLKGSDVAILKAEGTFPIVDLGSILNLRPLDVLTAMGFPGFIDGGPTTTLERTVPSVTRGYIETIEPQPADQQYKLIVTSVPIAPGNSGGPSFDENGVQIGVNTYAHSICEDGNCFGNGVIRDIDDLKQLAAVNGVQVGGGGSLTRDWRSAIEAVKSDDYVTAAKLFNKVANSYYDHYLAVGMRTVAENKAGVPIDYSSSFPVWIVAVVPAVVLFGIGAFIVIKKLQNRRSVPAFSAAPLPQPYAPLQQTVPPAQTAVSSMGQVPQQPNTGFQNAITQNQVTSETSQQVISPQPQTATQVARPTLQSQMPPSTSTPQPTQVEHLPQTPQNTVDTNTNVQPAPTVIQPTIIQPNSKDQQQQG